MINQRLLQSSSTETACLDLLDKLDAASSDRPEQSLDAYIALSLMLLSILLAPWASLQALITGCLVRLLPKLFQPLLLAGGRLWRRLLSLH